MGIETFTSGISGFIAWIIDKAIFWKNFTFFSQMLLLVIVVGIILLFKLLKTNEKKAYSFSR